MFNSRTTPRHRYPSTAYGHSYNYYDMPFITSSPIPTLTQRQAIGQLLRDIGTSVSMNYGPDGSAASMVCAHAYVNNFSYRNAKDEYTVSGAQIPTQERDRIILGNLAAGFPVMVGIAGSPGGHAVVADGFGYSSGTLYYHINMGWGSYMDAWYNLPLIDSLPGPYTSVVALTYNISPSASAELISDRVTSSTGLPIQGASVTATCTGNTFAGSTDSQGYYGILVTGGKSYTVSTAKTGFIAGSANNIAVGTSQLSDQYYSPGQWGLFGNYYGADFALASFSFTATALTNSVWLRWTVPTNCGMPNNTVYVSRRADRYPTNATAGAEIYRGTEQLFVDTNVDGSGKSTNYYTIRGNNGAPYAALSGVAQASACADPGRLKLYWTSQSALRAVVWLLKADGTKRSSCNFAAYAAGWNLSACAPF